MPDLSAPHQRWLTKSRYLDWRECPKRLYFQVTGEAIRRVPNAGSLRRRQDGVRVGALLRELLGPGPLVEGEDVVQQTAIHVLEGRSPIYEAAFEAKRCFVRVDALVLGPEGWEVVEAKSGLKEKPKYLHDLAFQTWVAKQAGLNVRRTKLVHVDGGYVCGSPETVRADAFLNALDVTERLNELLEEVEKKVPEALGCLDSTDQPTIYLQKSVCSGCDYHDRCAAAAPDDDLVYLPELRSRDADRLRNDGCFRISSLPDDYLLSPLQARVRDCVRTGSVWISPELPLALEGLAYPLHFIDFETVGACFPVWPGCQPWKTLPFQWSNHIVLSPTAEPLHLEFLADGKTDPREAFARTLLDSLEGAGTILTYTEFEQSRIRDLRVSEIPGGFELERLLESRMVDLHALVKRHVYHPDFHGSFSIKTVLPALCPDLGYKDLTIQEGDTASAEYLNSLESDDEETRQRIRRDLLAYCERDTWAMVRLLGALRSLAKQVPAQASLF